MTKLLTMDVFVLTETERLIRGRELHVGAGSLIRIPGKINKHDIYRDPSR